MDGEEEQLHILVFPLMAQGHVIPMIDTAKIFASRGLKVTVLTTPLNASLFSGTIHRSFPSIAVRTVEFPTAAAGLPDGCESLDFVSFHKMGFDDVSKFFGATDMLRLPFEDLLAETRPDCVLADWFFPWTTDSAAKYGIPRLVFLGNSFFATCLSELVRIHQPHKRVGSNSEPFSIPGLPGPPVTVSINQMPLLDRLLGRDGFAGRLFRDFTECEARSFGTVHNTVYEIEPVYADLYRTDLGIKAWSIGPVSLCNLGIEDRATRGKESSIDQHSCLQWLNSKKPRSVVYVCFGTLVNFSDSQLKDIAAGIEASRQQFVWVVREGRENDDSWLPAGFEERTAGKGMIIRGWAPQVLILDHEAVGGFVTHCGWNSTLEGITAGVPMVTWPVTAEQFYNEKLVTEILGIGIGVGAKQWTMYGEEWVESGAVATAVDRLMGESEEAVEMRRKARELGKVARRAVEEGGSSFGNISSLIEELRRNRRREKELLV